MRSVSFAIRFSPGGLARPAPIFCRPASKRSGLSIGEPAMAYVGVLRLGTSDFEAIDHHRRDEYLAATLGLSGVLAAADATGRAGGVR